MGITSQVTLSSGQKLPKRVFNRDKDKRLQRKLAKAKKGSNNRYNKRSALARHRYRQAIKNRNYLHRVTTFLISNVSGTLVVEDLQIGNMVKTKNLSRSILEQNWGTFINMLTYKAESASGRVIKVNPKNTSKTCYECGAIKKDLSLRDRVFTCDYCDHVEDRDINAAKNILLRGLAADRPGGTSIKEPGSHQYCKKYKDRVTYFSAKNSDIILHV